MKLLTLNIWGGHLKQPLLDFITSHQHTDVICLQEVYHNAKNPITDEDRTLSLNIFSELQTCLPKHNAYFRPAVNGIYGIGMLVKQDLEIVEEGEIGIYDNPDYPGIGPSHSRILQWLKCRDNNQSYTIMNVHGLWNGKGKSDSPARINQSKRIREFFDTHRERKLLCGDFNLRPDTESLKILEKDMNNLIRQYNINDTRTSYYPKQERYADYVITSPEIKINTFSVLPDEVSDHAPLLVDFD